MNRENQSEQLPYGYERNLGDMFEHTVGAITDLDLVRAHTPHIPALLETYESANVDALRQDIHADGYVFGVGAGAVFAMSLFFQSRDKVAATPPRALLACDIGADVILAGRTAVEILRQSATYGIFSGSLRTPDIFAATVRQMVAAEPNGRVRTIFDEVDPRQLAEMVRKLPQPATHGYGVQSFPDILSVQAVIREGWDVLKPLADEHNIGFALASFYDPDLHQVVDAMPDVAVSHNIIYGSNLPEYVSHPFYQQLIGSTVSVRDVPWLSFRRYMQPFNTPDNTFVLASTASRMAIQVFHGLPETTPPSFWQ